MDREYTFQFFYGRNNTSVSKIVDNAIVGYMIGREGAPPPRAGPESTALAG